MVGHLILNAMGILLGIFVAYLAGNYKLAIVHVLAAGMLWYYSTTFKKQLIIGNLMVALLSAMVPFMVVIFEMPSIIATYSMLWPDETIQFNNLFKYIFAFAIFAFISSLIREIIKDMEDYKGDLETGCETMPIKWGMRATKAIVIGLISNAVLLLSFIVYKLYSPADKLPTVYILLGLVLPFMYLGYKVYRAQDSKHYHSASILTKIIMLIGISFSFIIYYLSHYAKG
jgi:4-hydroxybenzoate polyprenyltransferase